MLAILGIFGKLRLCTCRREYDFMTSTSTIHLLFSFIFNRIVPINVINTFARLESQ